MFNKIFNEGDNVVVIKTNEYFDESKIARKLIFYGKVSKFSSDGNKMIIKNDIDEMECSSLAVLYTVVTMKEYLAELKKQLDTMHSKYIDIKTIYAIILLEDEWKWPQIFAAVFIAY